MDNEYSELKDEIRKSYFKKFYYNTINLCKKYSKLIVKFHRKEFNDIREDLFLINYYIGECHKKLYNIRNAIFYLKKSIRYAMNDTYLNKARVSLAECYEQICRFNKSIKNYNQALIFYKNIEDNKNRTKVLFEKAKLLDKPNIMLKIINIIEKEQNSIYIQNNKLLTQLYVKLALYYTDKHQIKKLRFMTGNIENINIQREILNAVQTQIEQIA